MLCIVALIIASILSIFSAKYRAIAKEAFYCTLNMLTLKPCSSSANTKLKSTIVSSLLNKNKTLAKFVFKYFDILSLLFTLLFILSILYSLFVIYNLIVYGTCDPSSNYCIITDSIFNQNSC